MKIKLVLLALLFPAVATAQIAPPGGPIRLALTPYSYYFVLE